MDETQNNQQNDREESKILVNEYGSTLDSTVVVEEADRTVLLTDTETIIFPKATAIDIVPKNRPRKVYGGMWGPTEIATIGLAFIAILGVALVYIFLVVPSNRELEQNLAERDRMERELISARSKYGNITDTETQVAKLLNSVNDFETSYLPAGETGRTALYQRINALIGAYGLVNTTGPDYAPLEIADSREQAESDKERGRTRFKSLFPGVYVSMTVEGSYQNLRRFLREIETGREFVVVSSVEIQPSDSEKPKTNPAAPPVSQPAGQQMFDQNGMPIASSINQGPVRPAAARGKTHGETVSLRLEMAAYFRRQNVIPPVAEQ